MRARWPAFGTKSTVVLPLEPLWPVPPYAVAVSGTRFEPKRELHVTVIGSTLGARLSDAIGCRALREDALVQAFEALDWSFERTHTLLRLAKDEDGTRVESLIEPIAMPALAQFHRALGELLGESLPTPPPHVTLYTAGSDEGVGVPDEATLRERLIAQVDPAALVRA